MKLGMRRPSIKKMISARTSVKRKAVNGLGLKMPKGWGWLKNPKKYTYNKIYRKTTFSIWDIFKIFK